MADIPENILKNAEELLRTSLWGRALTEAEMAKALAGTSERTFAAGAFICMKGQPVDYWMGVIDGLGKMASHWTTGKTTSLTGISSGGWFGEGSLLKNEVRRYDVMALRESRIAFMNRSTFLWLMDHSIPFNRYLITQLNERLGQFIGMLTDSRSFLSYPRHEYFRRILCDLVGQDVESGRIPDRKDWNERLIADVCYGNASQYFGFGK